MDIRLNFSHQIHIEQLGRLGHDLYIPNDEAQWNETVEEDFKEFYPHWNMPNVHFDEDVDDPDVVVKGEDADIDMPLNPKATHDSNCIKVYMTKTQMARHPPIDNLWYYLGKGVDTERFSGWEAPFDGDIVAVGNNIANRDHVFDLDVVSRLRDVFPDRFKVYGRGAGCDEFVTHTELSRRLKEAAVYVHIAHTSVSPNSLLEALSTGMPIVSVNGYNIDDFITNGYDGYITDNINNIIKEVHTALEGKTRWESVAESARKTAVGEFNLDRFLRRWDFLLRMAEDFRQETKK